VDTPKSITQRIEVDFINPHWDRWDVVDAIAEEDVVHVSGENEDGDTVTFDLHVVRVRFTPGPARREDFMPDRREERGDE